MHEITIIRCTPSSCSPQYEMIHVYVRSFYWLYNKIIDDSKYKSDVVVDDSERKVGLRRSVRYCVGDLPSSKPVLLRCSHTHKREAALGHSRCVCVCLP